MAAFAALIYSPGNYVKTYSIYAPNNNGQYPELQNQQADSQSLHRRDDGLLLSLDGKSAETYAHLFWIVSGKFLQEIKEKSVPYAIEFELADPAPNDVVIHLNRRVGGHVNKINLTPGTRYIRVSLEGEDNYADLDIYGMTLMVPHYQVRRELIINRVQIIALPQQ